MSEKTIWSEGFRNRLSSSKYGMATESTENFQNIKGEENENDGDDENEENEEIEKTILEKEMVKRLKEEYKKKMKRMEMENFKHIELMENIEDTSRVPNINVGSLQRLVANFSTLSDKLNKLKQNTSKAPSKKEEVGKTEEKKEEKKGAIENMGVGGKPGESDSDSESDSDGEESSDDESSDDESDSESESDMDENKQPKIESFKSKKDDSDSSKKESGGGGGSENILSILKDKLNELFAKAQSSFNSLGSEINEWNDYIPEKLCSIFTIGGKVSNDDVEVIRTIWLRIISFFVTIYVFINWFYVIYFEKLATDMIEPDVFLPYLKFFKNIPGHYLFNFFFEIPFKVLDTLKEFAFYFLKTLPMEWGIGLEFIIPLFLYLIYNKYSNLGANVFNYIKQLLNGQGLESNYTTIIFVMTLLFILMKLPWVYIGSALFNGPIYTSIYTIVWFILKVLICVPISILSFILFYVYYSFFVILAQPIKDLGILGTLGDIHEKLSNFNPIYSNVIHTANCVTGADICKQHTLGSFIFNLILIPSMVFIIRHFLSFLVILLFIIIILTALTSIQSLTLKANIVGFFGIFGFFIIMLCRWFKNTTIAFPTSPDTSENKPINMGLIPFFGGINIILLFMYFFYSKLLSKVSGLKYIFMISLVIGIIIQFLYVVSMYPEAVSVNSMKLLFFMAIFSVISYFGFGDFWKTAVGKLILSMVFLGFILMMIRF